METTLELTQWLPGARRGCPEARAKMLTFCRAYLERLKDYRIACDCQAKVEADDLIRRRYGNSITNSTSMRFSPRRR